MAEYLRKECGDLNEVAPDNADDKDDDDDASSKDIEVAEIGTNEALTLGAFLHQWCSPIGERIIVTYLTKILKGL